jgi:hypothetical protein
MTGISVSRIDKVLAEKTVRAEYGARRERAEVRLPHGREAGGEQ